VLLSASLYRHTDETDIPFVEVFSGTDFIEKKGLFRDPGDNSGLSGIDALTGNALPYLIPALCLFFRLQTICLFDSNLSFISIQDGKGPSRNLHIFGYHLKDWFQYSLQIKAFTELCTDLKRRESSVTSREIILSDMCSCSNPIILL
jgi:hypothetical protein